MGWRWVLEWRKCDTLMALPSSGSEAFSGPLEWQQQQKWPQQKQKQEKKKTANIYSYVFQGERIKNNYLYFSLMYIR